MGSHAITPDPIAVELEYYKERNYVIHTRNELLEKENREAHNKIRDLSIQIARSEHPAGKAREYRPPHISKEGFEALTKGMADDQKETFKKFMGIKDE